jgi:hypothetical protein
VTNACYIKGYICKNKSPHRCVGEGLNLKNTVWRHKMSLKPCSVFFFKTTWLFKDSYLEQGVTIDNKTFKSNFLFSLVAAQNRENPT